MPTIDWTDLARRLGSLTESGEHSGTELARAALEVIVGSDLCESAVDHYVGGEPGGELARSVLWHVRPWSAMQRCHEIYEASSDLIKRRRAVELLRVVADHRALPWVPLYLADPDPEIQAWSAGILYQLLFSDLVDPEQCESLLQSMAEHPQESVRERHAFIRTFLAEREGPATLETWTVWRQDDGGNKFVVSSGLQREEAERLVRELESRGHKQTYWTSRDSEG